MRKPLLVITLVAASLATGFAKEQAKVRRPNGVAAAFFDEERLQDATGKATMENFQYFLPRIQEIVKRDFPGVEFRIVRRGELLPLPDGTALNVQNVLPKLGFVLAAPGRKRRFLSESQSEADFACAAGAFFRRHSPACPR
jgi:hypothetical protein